MLPNISALALLSKTIVPPSLGLREQAESQPHLNRIDAGIGPRNSGIGDMHVAHFRAPIIFAAQKMRSERATGGEINVGCAFRHLYIGEKRSATEV